MKQRPATRPIHIEGRNEYEEEIRAEQVKQIYALAPIGLIATFLNALIVFYILKDIVPISILGSWLAVILSVTFLRTGLVWRFRRTDFHHAAAPAWGRRFNAGLVLIGLAWGGLGAIPFTTVPVHYQLFIAFVLGGMMAGAAATFSILKGGYLAFSLPTLAPFAIHFFLIADMLHCAMGGMFVLFGVLLWRLSVHTYRVHRTSFLLRFENRGMIERLQQEMEHGEELNRQLRTEVEARRRAEAELRAQQRDLERTVGERTRDLRLANEQLQGAKEAAEAANRAKSEFLANMSHEMRTPLAGAMGMINLILHMEIGEQPKQLLEMAKRSADSLLRLISDLLDFSSLEAGVITFEKKFFFLSEVIATAVEVVSLQAAEKGLQLSWKVDGAAPEKLAGDAGRLRQVLVNLLGNAVKFTRQGKVEVSVCPFHDPQGEEGQFLLFSIRDTGVGIPPDQLERIFGKFTQVDSSRTRKYGGVGLGLALSKQIVERTGGRIWAESCIGEGSVFYFTYPLA